MNGQRAAFKRRQLAKSNVTACAYCHRDDVPLTIDHIVPRSRG